MNGKFPRDPMPQSPTPWKIAKRAGVSVQTPPPNPLPSGAGDRHKLLFHKTPSPQRGEGQGGGCERLRAGNS